MIFILSLLWGCALFQTRENSIFTQEEMTILEKTTNVLDYGYGYDTEIELNYIYSYSFSDLNFDKKEKKFAMIVKEIDIDTLKAFYEKTYKLYAMTDYKMTKYKEDEEWKYHLFIKNELYPPLEKYTILLQKYLFQRDSSSKEIFNDEKKETIKREIEKHFVEEEEVVDTF